MGNIVELFERHTGYVCANCFNDYAIKAFINKNKVSNEKCSFCNRKTQNADLHEVFNFFMDGLSYDWDDPGNCMGWNGQEGGWQGATVYDGDELIQDHYYDIFKNDKLKDYFADSLSQQQFCRENPYGLTQEEILRYGWEEFANSVKHKIRFLFNEYREKKLYTNLEDLEPADFLKALGAQLKHFNLIYIMPSNTAIYRIRVHNIETVINTASELGTCPDTLCTVSNRMSPAGIGMFYGAFEEDTALAETVDWERVQNKVATIGIFKNIKELRLIDLTYKSLPKTPSPFDQEQRKYISGLTFLRKFIKDLTISIERDGREHFEYVPTQIITEFLRYFPIYDSNLSIDGLLYDSAKNNKKACVLFASNAQCVDTPQSGATLQLDQIERRILTTEKS
jgi:hypothetical protein